VSALADTMRQVVADCETDAAALDRTPFTPRGVGEAMGSTLAMVAAVARAVARLDSDLDELRETIGAERVERQDAIESLQRVLDARTERFA
jgi:hypothetical protein